MITYSRTEENKDTADGIKTSITETDTSYEPRDDAIVKSDVAETITETWTLNAGTIPLKLKGAGIGSLSAIKLEYVDSAGTQLGYIGYASTVNNKFIIYNAQNDSFAVYTNGVLRQTITGAGITTFSSTVESSSFIEGGTALSSKYHPLISSPNTAFNKNFGSAIGTVSEGDHTHASSAQTDANEDIIGAWSFQGAGTEFTIAPQFNLASAEPFKVLASSLKVNNLDADKLDGYDESAFARLSNTSPSTGYLYIQASTTNNALQVRQDSTGNIQSWYASTNQKAYLTTAGLMVADDYKSLSDERVKANFKKPKYSNLYNKVLQIAELVMNYERTDKDNISELGWVAQSLQKIAPEYVNIPDKKEEMWSVSYNKMVVPLYSAIGLIENRLSEIENRLTKIENNLK